MNKDNNIYIQDIIDCINKITAYTKNCQSADFLTNSMMKDAVIRNFEVIGEAAKKLTPEFRAMHPEIEWKKMAGMRDKLIHDYMGIDYWAVWGVIEQILPNLRLQLLNIVTPL